MSEQIMCHDVQAALGAPMLVLALASGLLYVIA